MTDKELVTGFFIEGYVNQNYDFIMDHVSESYIDHSPAGAKSNKDAVGILKIVAGMFDDLKIDIMDIFGENGMVAVRVRYDAIQTGECAGIAATGKQLVFEALEYFKIENGKITESWGYWPDKEIEQKLTGE